MSDNGYVYVLMNPSLQNMVKIGKTTREPEERAKELSSVTGVPTPFIVVYSCMFESCSDAETFVHTYLETKGFRVASNREFFEIPINIGIDAVIKAKEHFGEFTINDNDKEDSLEGEEILTNQFENFEIIANNYTNGENGYVQNIKKAVEYYKKALKLGSSNALYQLGNIYSGLTTTSDFKLNYNMALEYYNQYLEKENDSNSYMSLAYIYILKEHITNALIILNKMFSDKRGINLSTIRKLMFSLTIGRFDNRQEFSFSLINFEYIISESNIIVHSKLLEELKDNMENFCRILTSAHSKALEENPNNDFIINNITEEREALESLKTMHISIVNDKLLEKRSY